MATSIGLSLTKEIRHISFVQHALWSSIPFGAWRDVGFPAMISQYMMSNCMMMIVSIHYAMHHIAQCYVAYT